MEVVTAIERTLRANPDDLASWLRYADQLLAQGDPRGTLIHLEQRRTRTRPADRGALADEIAAITAEHQPAWDAELPNGVTALERRYGFATKVGVEWSERAPALIEQALRGPLVTALRITPPTQGEEDDEDDEDWQLWEEFEEDDLPIVRPVEAGALASLDLGGLVELDLSHLPIGEAGATALAAATGTDRIERLDLRYCAVGDAGLAALLASSHFDNLRHLHLQCNSLTGEGVRALHRLERLVELDLRYNAIGSDGVDALLAAPFTGSLTRLLLYRTDVSGAGVTKLARAPQLPPALRSLWRSM